MASRRTGCAVFLASIAATCFVFSAFSAESNPKAPSYPWQTLPERCKGKNPMPDKCVFEDWPNHDEAGHKLTFLYKTEQFELLERGFEEVSALGKIGKTGLPLETVVYATVSHWYSWSRFDPEEFARIARWKIEAPKSNFVHLAEAMFLYHKAWEIRGEGYADTVSTESWKLISQYHHQAQKTLLAAPERLRSHPAWYHGMLKIALEIDSLQAVELLLEQLAAKWPTYYPAYDVVASRLQPKWGSSWRRLETFAGKWTTFLEGKRSDGSAQYARIYNSVKNQASFDEMKPDWAKLKKGFETLIANHPEYHNYKNNFASYACAARDKPAFLNAMKLIDKETLLPEAWIRGHSHEACKEWAFLKS